MFTQELTISSEELIELLLDSGYIHKGFKDAMLTEMSHTRCLANQKNELYNNITLKLEAKELL